MDLWWSLRTLCLLACQAAFTIDDSGLCCCVPCHTCDVSSALLGPFVCWAETTMSFGYVDDCVMYILEECVVCVRWWCCMTTKHSGRTSWRCSAGTPFCCCTRTVRPGGWESCQTASRVSSLPATSPWLVGAGSCPSFVFQCMTPCHAMVVVVVVVVGAISYEAIVYCTTRCYTIQCYCMPHHMVGYYTTIPYATLHCITPLLYTVSHHCYTIPHYTITLCYAAPHCHTMLCYMSTLPQHILMLHCYTIPCYTTLYHTIVILYHTTHCHCAMLHLTTTSCCAIRHYTILHLLWYATLYHTMIYYTTLYPTQHVMFHCYTTPWYAMLHHTISCHATLYYTMLCHTALYHTMLCNAVLHYTAQYMMLDCYTTPWYAMLRHTISHHATLYYTMLWYTALCRISYVSFCNMVCYSSLPNYITLHFTMAFSTVTCCATQHFLHSATSHSTMLQFTTLCHACPHHTVLCHARYCPTIHCTTLQNTVTLLSRIQCSEVKHCLLNSVTLVHHFAVLISTFFFSSHSTSQEEETMLRRNWAWPWFSTEWGVDFVSELVQAVEMQMALLMSKLWVTSVLVSDSLIAKTVPKYLQWCA